MFSRRYGHAIEAAMLAAAEAPPLRGCRHYAAMLMSLFVADAAAMIRLPALRHSRCHRRRPFHSSSRHRSVKNVHRGNSTQYT